MVAETHLQTLTARQRLAYWNIGRVAGKRSRIEAPEAIEERIVLVVLPEEQEALEAAWRFVDLIDLDVRQMTLVQTGGSIGFAPARYVGHARTLKSTEFNVLELPEKKVAREIWSKNPDVAIDLHTGMSLAGLLLVGGSPAAIRIGFHHQLSEPFFDFMIAPGDGLWKSYQSLFHYLSSLNPAVLPFSEAP